VRAGTATSEEEGDTAVTRPTYRAPALMCRRNKHFVDLPGHDDGYKFARSAWAFRVGSLQIAWVANDHSTHHIQKQKLALQELMT
jgi:hypothetical protein